MQEGLSFVGPKYNQSIFQRETLGSITGTFDSIYILNYNIKKIFYRDP